MNHPFQHHQLRLEECCTDALADAIDECILDFSEGQMDPELSGYLTQAVIEVLSDHLQQAAPCSDFSTSNEAPEPKR